MFIEPSSNKKTISGLFLGNPLSFSDTVVQLADAELPCLGFSRAASLTETLFMEDEAAETLRILVVDETLMDELIELAPQLRIKFPHANFAFAFRTNEIAARLWRSVQATPDLGQISFLPMRLDVDSWLSVLRLLVCGENYVPVDLMSPVIAPAQTVSDPEPDGPAPADVHLTERELEVLRSAAAGKQNKIIADELNLSQHTVKLHMHHVMTKLGLHNRTEAAIWYLGHCANTAEG